MDDFTKGLLLSLIPALLVSVTTAIVTVKLSVRQFTSQKWWEKKAEAYSKVLEHLAGLSFYFRELEIELLRELDRPPSADAVETEGHKLVTDYRRAREALLLTVFANAYLINPDATQAVHKLLGKLDLDLEEKTHNYYEFVALGSNATLKCFEIVKENAQADLLGKKKWSLNLRPRRKEQGTSQKAKT